jgi:hypothetical protein
MKKYILNNLEPILLGIVIGLLIMVLKETTKEIILSIKILQEK